jgi:probable phosphoglycerate mutase
MIYLVRHGMDDERYIGGWSDVDLTEVGIEQTNELSAFIKNSNFTIKKIYASDVKRAVTTANIIGASLKIEPHYTSKLRELNKGLLTGLEVEKAKSLYPNYFESITINTKYPNGESMIDLHNRVKKLLEIIKKQDDILLITHRGVINMIYFLINDKEPDMNKSQFGVTHASIHELDMKSKTIKKLR